MMDPVTSSVATMVVVTAGRWSQNKGLEASVVIGAGVFAIFLSVIASSQPKFASQVGVLVLVVALMTYMIPISKSLGWDKGFDGKPTTPTTPTRP